jgi:hypothetical protein
MKGSVAVIGAGPGGLVATRWLLSQGFQPTIFEQGPMLGGQWTGLDGLSGVWPTMHTNIGRVLTAFSDLEHRSDVVYPSNRDILDYLHRYAETFGLPSHIRPAGSAPLSSAPLSRAPRNGFRFDDPGSLAQHTRHGEVRVQHHQVGRSPRDEPRARHTQRPGGIDRCLTHGSH